MAKSDLRLGRGTVVISNELFAEWVELLNAIVPLLEMAIRDCEQRAEETPIATLARGYEERARLGKKAIDLIKFLTPSTKGPTNE